MQQVNYSRSDISPSALVISLPACVPPTLPFPCSRRRLLHARVACIALPYPLITCEPVQSQPTCKRASTSQRRLLLQPLPSRSSLPPPPPPRNNYTQTPTPPSSVRAHIRLLLSLLLLASRSVASPRPDRYSYTLLNCQSTRLPDSRAAISLDCLPPDLDVCA